MIKNEENKMKNGDTQFKIDMFELSFLAEACIPYGLGRPIARTVFWQKLINEFYYQMSFEERSRFYVWMMRNENLKDSDHILASYFRARFNPENQYRFWYTNEKDDSIEMMFRDTSFDELTNRYILHNENLDEGRNTSVYVQSDLIQKCEKLKFYNLPGEPITELHATFESTDITKFKIVNEKIQIEKRYIGNFIEGSISSFKASYIPVGELIEIPLDEVKFVNSEKFCDIYIPKNKISAIDKIQFFYKVQVK